MENIYCRECNLRIAQAEPQVAFKKPGQTEYWYFHNSVSSPCWQKWQEADLKRKAKVQ